MLKASGVESESGKSVSAENVVARKAHYRRRFLATIREILQITHWMAGDTVLIAPVSTDLPANKEFYREKHQNSRFACQQPIRNAPLDGLLVKFAKRIVTE